MNKSFIFIVVILVLIAIFTVNYLHTIFFALGNVSFNKNNYKIAAEYYNKALMLSKGNNEYRYSYVLALTKLPATVANQKAIFTIAHSDKKDKAQDLATRTIKQWRKTFLKNIGTNYIEQAVSQSGIIRWDTEKFPIKVAIINDYGSDLPSYFISGIKQVLSDWQTATGFIKFQLIDNPKHADITITIKHLPQDVCNAVHCQYTIGFTSPEYTDNILKHMDVVLYANNPTGKFFTEKMLHNTILHELGHSLGIMGHSYNSDDIMYMENEGENEYSDLLSSYQNISEADINTLKILYKMVPDITNTNHINTNGLVYAPIILGTNVEMLYKKLEEAKDYVKSAPNLTNGYIDLGIVYMQLNQSTEALKAMKKAYNLAKSDSEKSVSAYNLGLVYYEMKDYSNAKKYAEIAKQISNSDDIETLIEQINSFME